MPQGGFPIPYAPRPYQSDNNIAELIMRAGQQRAALQQQMFQGLAGSVEQLGQIHGQIQQQKLLEARTQREERMGKAAEAKIAREEQDRAALDAAEGSGLDPDQIEAKLPGHLKGQFRESWNRQQEQKAKYEKAQLEATNAQADMLGNGAKYLKNHLQDPDGGVGAATMWVQTLPKALQERAAPYMQQVQKNPQALGQILNGLIQQSPAEQARLQRAADEEYTLKPGDVRYKGGKEVASGGAKEETRSIEVQLADPNITPERRASLLKAKSDAALAGRDPNAAGTRNDARSDKSFQFNMKELEDRAKPLIDKADRFNRLVTTVDEKTPQADALIAPELLTVMAGGRGSGVRMTEAEMSRLVNGRSHWESLKAAVNKWKLDPTQALTVTDEQRSEIKKLLATMGGRIKSDVKTINDARRALVNADSVDEHRNIMADLGEKLSAVADEEDVQTIDGVKVRRLR